MTGLGLQTEVVDASTRDRAVARFREAKILLPRLSQLANPVSEIPQSVRSALAKVEPDARHPLNLFRVHWHNDAARTGLSEVPGHFVIPPEVTGVRAPIVVALGERFPMIGAHKVLAAYGCLAPRVITGQFDPTRHRALWPSTGNYCRGGVAISRIMGCRGVAILPAGMSKERFNWLEAWVADPGDIIRTPGTESNVKEIYDECARLSQDPDNVILNQFSELGNHLVHFLCTGQAMECVFHAVARPGQRAAAFVSATGSAGTLAAGDYLKERLGAKVVAVEATECPTMLENGFGEHNIQGIGDKHIPLIHNVMGTDIVVGVSDRATDELGVLFGTPIGQAYLRERRGLHSDAIVALASLGLSGICNVLAAIKAARALDLGPDDVVLTVATDSSRMYHSERETALERHFPEGFDAITAGETFGQHLLGAATDHVLLLTHQDRKRIFNLGYFTWVEQQGISVEDFVARRQASFWTGLRSRIGAWDALIDEFNRRTGVSYG